MASGTRSRLSRMGCTGVAVTILAMTHVSGLAQEWVVPQTVPPGVTLVEVTRALRASSDQVLWTRLGAADGATLLVSQADRPGVSTCLEECTEAFPPLLVTGDSTPFGDWSVIRRTDGTQQWAYQGSPLYSWVEEQAPGEVATNVGLAETADLKAAEGLVGPGALLPPPGWDVARFGPAATISVPAGLNVRLVDSAQAVVVTDFLGYTLYGFAGDAARDDQSCADSRCARTWVPVPAPALAGNVGEFSVVSRTDGTMQWAYRDRPLYRFAGDLLPGDAHGRAVDDRWHLAAVSVGFRPDDVAVTTLAGYGDVLSLEGMTLYVGSAFEKYWGGRNLRDSFKVAYFLGKRLGGDACSDDGCRATWRPFLAPAEARSTGFWEVIARRDGTRQWAYKGFALYTNAGDTSPGHHRGHAIYEFTDPAGRTEALERVVLLADIGNAGGGAGIYWNIVKP